jgi:hypothetical protein
VRGRDKALRKKALCLRALADLAHWAAGGAQMAAAE